MGLDIDLYTPKIDISEDEADDIIIEITGLKSISKFIGLEDTPLYYDNGKFFKVENNKIIYTDIEWKDISGNLEDAPELVSLIEKLIEEYNKEIINRYINIHNNSRTAHPYIQDIISQNYITLDTKIDNTKEELSEDISNLDNKLNIEINNREVADNRLSENIQQETLARIETDTTLQNNINILTNNLSTETENRISADNLLRDDIDNISGGLAQEIINRQTQDNLLQEQITSNYNTLNNKVDTESSNRISADTTLQNNIDTLTNTVEDNNTAINNRVDGIVDSFDGDISDLNNAVDNLTDTVTNNYTDLNEKITVNSNDITTIQNTINTYGDIVTYNATDFATKNQGLLADSALQPNDNISELVNNVGYITGITSSDIQTALGYTPYDSANPDGYITSADLPTLQDLTTQAQMDAINSGATSTNIGQIATNTQAISTETTNRQNADNNLQSQIDALVVSSDVFDIVGTYAELQAYDISTVPVNDIIKVLVDSTHNNSATYYRCVENNNVKSWSYIGAEGAYYTKSESDSLFVPQTRTINNYALSNNITLTASDVGALPSDTQIGNGTITLTQGGTQKGTFTLNQTGNVTIDLDAGGGGVDVQAYTATEVETLWESI